MSELAAVGKQDPIEKSISARSATAAKLTDRDKDLLGLLVLTRYLTAAQVHRLAFAGKHQSLPYRRLLKLSRENGQPAFARQRFFRTYDGNRVAVWAPTPHAMPAALARVGDPRGAETATRDPARRRPRAADAAAPLLPGVRDGDADDLAGRGQRARRHAV